MPTIVVNGQELDFKLALFDLDGTLIDDKPRYTSLPSFRMKEIEKRGGRKAAIEWASLSGFNYDSQSIDMGGAISKAPRREVIAIAAAAIYKVT